MLQRISTSLPYTELEVATGNYDTFRLPIDRIIIHTMVGTWQGAAARFDNPAEHVSAHYGVKLDGTLIHWLEEFNTAYHAGNYLMNQRSIGIEHEDNGDYNGVRPDILYTESAKLVADICRFYNIPIDRQHILKHSEIIATGCPDALDIDRIVREAASHSNHSPSSSSSASQSPSASSSPSLSPSASQSTSDSPSPSSSPSEDIPLMQEFLKIESLIDSKWTWFGKNGWKSKLTQLRTILHG